MRALAIDLYCGLGGWAEGFLAEGYDVVGFDIERRPYPGQLVLQDALTLDGAQFRDAAVIVASPPCQAYSYRAMPWKRAKALPPPDNALFEACFRIQREACKAAGRYIPLVVENVCGAQKWVGRAKWHYGSYYLWGDVPALMPATGAFRKVNHHLGGDVPKGVGKTSWFHGNTKHELRSGVLICPKCGAPVAEDHNSFQCHKCQQLWPKGHGHETYGVKASDPTYGTRGWFGPHGGTNVSKEHNGYGVKQGGEWWHDPKSHTRRFSSRSAARKHASALIAKIPFPLAQHIARVYRPEMARRTA